MQHLQRLAVGIALVLSSLLTGGCTTTLVLMHVHQKLTEGDPTPCVLLNSVDRALQARCGPFVPGSLQAKDVAAASAAACPLMLAARDSRFWPVLPELLERGAQPEHCERSPIVELAQAQPSPDFAAASPASLQAIRWLAVADARAIHHDVVRSLSCPSARTAGLHSVLDDWQAQGLLPPGELSFSPLGALHPSHLGSTLAQRLEAQGHHARAALDSFDGHQAPGFEEALRNGDWEALDWWLARLPELVNRVPASRPNQLPWIPLARVLTPSFVPDAAQQRGTVDYLLAHGADPWQRLPHEQSQTVLGFARQLKSPLVPVLEAPVPSRTAPEPPVETAVAAGDAKLP
jgi:hypothetical protein